MSLKRAVIPKVVIVNPGTLNEWIPDNDLGNDVLGTHLNLLSEPAAMGD
jgi:hypothetical protein